MKKNLGTADRAARAVIGLGLITWGLIAQNWIGAIGAIPLLTAILGFCPAYCPFGFNTARKAGPGGGCCGGGKCG
jgi:hypothetical protein